MNLERVGNIKKGVLSVLSMVLSGAIFLSSCGGSHNPNILATKHPCVTNTAFTEQGYEALDPANLSNFSETSHHELMKAVGYICLVGNIGFNVISDQYPEGEKEMSEFLQKQLDAMPSFVLDYLSQSVIGIYISTYNSGNLPYRGYYRDDWIFGGKKIFIYIGEMPTHEQFGLLMHEIFHGIFRQILEEQENDVLADIICYLDALGLDKDQFVIRVGDRMFNPYEYEAVGKSPDVLAFEETGSRLMQELAKIIWRVRYEYTDDSLAVGSRNDNKWIIESLVNQSVNARLEGKDPNEALSIILQLIWLKIFQEMVSVYVSNGTDSGVTDRLWSEVIDVYKNKLLVKLQLIESKHYEDQFNRSFTYIKLR